MVQAGWPAVSVYVASANTAPATELCLRTLRATAGCPHSLTVGDCGSTDGSLAMLRRFEGDGWLSLEVAPSGRHHAVWLDHWLQSCTSDYAVFVDSDIEFRRQGWLAEMVSTATRENAAIVAAEMLEERRDYRVPVATTPEGERVFADWFRGLDTVRLAARPAPWLLLVDVPQVAALATGFGFHSEPAEIHESLIAFDVGGALHRMAQVRGLRVLSMPATFGDAYHHYGGLSWIPLRGRRGVKKVRDRCVVRCRLWRWRRHEVPVSIAD